ncbi:creatininase family protein [Salipaludibacillus daqingensis]|uniref:creatininase family protein n=1 Tax=Salipaludibacillus daqingensis TaxID=3041001 RepID=UPI002475A082|nr:creatininase family protein [Salipaludibacillus daqingensis]
MAEYAHLKWPDVAEMDKNNSVAIVPLGATEEHGHHLPLDVDTEIATNICREAAKQTGMDVVLPAIPFGFESHHMGFPGTIDIPSNVLIEFGRAVTASLAQHGFRHIILVNGHGSNRPVIDLVARNTIVDFPDTLCSSISWWELKKVRDAAAGLLSEEPTSHGCDLETSVYMFLHPDRVDMKKARADGLDSISPHFWNDLLGRRPEGYANPAKMMEIWHTMTESGVRGDPRTSTADKGKIIFKAAATELAELLNEFRERKPRKPIGPVMPEK